MVNYSLAKYGREEFHKELDEYLQGGKHTGIPSIDKHGGLNPTWLYVLVAPPATGKTSLMLQIADYLATEEDTTVFYFHEEQNRMALLVRNLQRFASTFEDPRTGSFEEILRAVHSTGNNYWKETEEEYYDVIGDGLQFVYREMDVTRIDEIVGEYIKETGRKPVVIVDHLQLLDKNGTDEKSKLEQAGQNVRALKQQAEKHKIPYILISTVAREYYTAPIGIESPKFSGDIEYSVDVLWGLQYNEIQTGALFLDDGGKAKKRSKYNELKAKREKLLYFCCLKAKVGEEWNTTLEFDGLKSHFVETGKRTSSNVSDANKLFSAELDKEADY